MGRKGEWKKLVYQFIEENKGKYSLANLCSLFGVSRSGFYRFSNHVNTSEKNLLELIKKCQFKNRQTYGYRRIKVWLQRVKGLQINAKRILRIMRKYSLLSVIRRKPKRISKGKENFRYPNLLCQDFTADRKNEKWVTDISYIHTSQGIFYLSVIQDLFDRSIVSYQLSHSPDTELVLKTIEKAYRIEKVADGLILHSDQGAQYTSNAYFRLTQSYGIVPSMSRRGNCYDNGVIENFFGTLKTESIYQSKPRTFDEAKRIIDRYIHFYNHERLQLKSGQTPLEVRRLSA